MAKLIINKNSILNKIPVELDTRQVYILEGIRYSINMISISYDSLVNTLFGIGQEDQRDNIEFYVSFKEVWSIIDGASRLESLMKLIIRDESSIESPIEISNIIDLEFLTEAKDFRNTLQHLDERIDETIINNNRTVWGVLHWIHAINKKTFYACTLVPGHVRKNYSANIPNHLGQMLNPPIDKVVLESVNRSKTDPIININISNLLKKIKVLSLNLEKQLELQFEGFESNAALGQDLFIRMTLKAK